MLLLAVAFLESLAFRKAVVAAPLTYYVSPDGRDSNAGTSSSKPWKTIKKVNSIALPPGTTILFQGGKSFTGSLYLDQADKGTPEKPIRISSYGTGRATISSPGSANALFAYNTSGIVIENINFKGGGKTSGVGHGINFYADVAGDVNLPYVVIKNAEIKNFGKTGLLLGTWNNNTHFSNVTIDSVSSHDNGENGIIIYSQVPYNHESVAASNVRVYNNTGIPNHPVPSGDGLVFGGVNGGIIENSWAHNNGALSNHASGPVGIFVYDSENILVQNNKSFRNRTGSWVDGLGFDFGQNTRNSTMTNNISYENDGPGYLIDHSPDAGSNSGNIITLNSSRDDGHKNGNFGIMIWGRVENAAISNNTVYATEGNNQTSGGIHVSNIAIEDKYVNSVMVNNNTITTVGGILLIKVDKAQLAGAQDLIFQDNHFTVVDGDFLIQWGDQSFASEAAWTSATGNN